jgi:hypothetical protein
MFHNGMSQEQNDGRNLIFKKTKQTGSTNNNKEKRRGEGSWEDSKNGKSGILLL